MAGTSVIARLIDVVAEVGLDRNRAEAVLSGNDGLEAIKEAEGLSRRHRVDGVPFFIINGKITLGGAQPPEAFLEAFGKVVGGKQGRWPRAAYERKRINTKTTRRQRSTKLKQRKPEYKVQLIAAERTMATPRKTIFMLVEAKSGEETMAM